MQARFLLLMTVLAGLPAAASAQAPKKIDFVHDVIPLIKARCAECHTNGKYKGSLSLETRESILQAKVVVPGKSRDSELYQRITSPLPETRMPSKGQPLSAREIEILTAWIDQGLAWEEGYSFKITAYRAPLKPRRVVLPAGTHPQDHPIDRILAAYFKDHKVSPPQALDEPAFIRRLYLDVIGMLPEPALVELHYNEGPSNERAGRIRSVLDDRRAYAEHWLTFWNDLLRNDYQGTGYIDGGRKQITAWLYRSLLDNKPYDDFVRELISPTPESEGFIKGIQWRGNVNASQVTELQFAQSISQVFFGANLKCASCHDSFIDSWKLDDAYGMAAIVAVGPLEIHRCDKPTGKYARPYFLWPELGAIDAAKPRAERLQELAGLVTHPDNGRFARTIVNRIWRGLFGRGIVHPVDVMANRPWSEDLLDYLANYFVENGHDLKKLIEHIVSSRAYQSKAVIEGQETPADEYVFRGPHLKRMTAEQFVDAVWMITQTGPAKITAPIKPPGFPEKSRPERRLVRAALVNSDLLMRSLGRPNREQVVTTRGDVLTTLQALDLSNGQILAETLSRGAARMLASDERAPAKLVDGLFFRALGRRPTRPEMEAGMEILGNPPTRESLADLLWAVVMLPEFQLIR